MYLLRTFGGCILATSALGLAALSSGQTVIGNFETPALDGWGSNGGPGSPNYAQGTVGVTLGSYSLDSSIAQGSFWGPSTGNLVTEGLTSALMNSTQISYDLTLDSVDLNGGSGNFDGYAQDNAMAIQLYSNTANKGGVLNLFIQENFTGDDSDSSGQNATWSGVDGTRHLVWNLNDFTATDPNTNTTKTVAQFLQAYGSQMASVQFDFVEQTGGASAPVGNTHFYFDNVQLNGAPTPEPVSVGLLGFGAAALIRRRRRR